MRVGKMRLCQTKCAGAQIHLPDKRRLASGYRDRQRQSRIIAGMEHHAVKQGTQGKLLPANNAHGGAAGFHGIADRDHHIEIRAGFNGENAGHDFGGACHRKNFVSVLFV